jgi:hypothetical protein
MFRMSRKRSLGLAVIVALVSAAGAIAYWTTDGSGSGSAGVAAGQSDLTVNQTTVLSPMYPGDSAQTISGDFDNSNSGPSYVAAVTASIASVTKAGGAPAGTCNATDFTLANAVMTVDAQVPAGNAQGSWTGATLKFSNKAGTNQDACKGATVGLSYAVS